MMGARAMEDLKEMICRELEEIADKGELSAGDLDVAHKLIVAKEKLLRIEELEDELGYSMDGGWSAEGTYSRNSYNRDNSYRGRNRDSMGRYSRRGGRYSMAEGREMMTERLQSMMDDPAISQADRQVLQRAMEQLSR